MKIAVNSLNLEVTRVQGDFSSLPGVTNNGQHYQLAGHVLAQVDLEGDGVELCLYHPTTRGMTGHIDVRVHLKYDEVILRRYSGAQPITFGDLDTSMKEIWPTGSWDLIQTIFAVEGYLCEEIGTTPRLQDFLVSCASDRQRLVVSEVTTA